MILSKKVLWSEGLVLNVQHLQRLDRYHEARQRHLAAAIHACLWGVEAAKWDIEGVGRNTLRADTLTLIFQDGEIYQAPLSDELPPKIDLGALPHDEQCFTFFAALPALNESGGNLVDGSVPAADGRYVRCDAQTPDLYSEGWNINLSYVTKRVRLLSHLDARDGGDVIPVVRVRRKADNSFEIDPTFMAPALSVDAEPVLQGMLRRLLGRLTAKADALYQMQPQTRGQSVDAHSTNVSSFFMLHSVNVARASLTHCANAGCCHPERLFAAMMAVAGGLMAFSTKYAVDDLPAYVHENPAPAFFTLNAIIEELLDTVISSKYIAIPLLKERLCYAAKLDAIIADGPVGLYLAVSANMPAEKLVGDVPRLFKIGAPQDVDRMITQALHGTPVLHMAQVPPQAPVRPGTCYFSIEARGQLYEAIIKAQAIAIFAPTVFDQLKVELFAIKA